MTSAIRQLAALLALRWLMLRHRGLQLGLLTTALFLGWLLHLVVTSGKALDAPMLATAVELAPSAYLGFGILALVAPLVAGGGNDVIPPDQLVSFPVHPSTQFLGGLALAPLNLVWALQLMGLAAMTAFLTVDTSLAGGALTTAAYVAALTVLGQAVAWLVAGLRQTRVGRVIVGAAAGFVLLTAVLVIRSGLGRAALAASPAHEVVQAVGGADTRRWATTTLVLLVIVTLGLLSGTKLCRWALSRAGDVGSARYSGPLRRRSARRGPLRELIAVDRASVWRAPAMRRGGLVLTLLPGLIAAGAAVPWESLIVLPGLVAAGAGLLFGVNVFCLDGSGALWLASLPSHPSLVARAKAVVIGETVLSAAVVAALAGSLRSPGQPTSAQFWGIVAAAVACSAVVVAQCLRSSVRRPHRAELRGPRDAVAPPGSLAYASVRLAVPTALIGMIIAAGAAVGVWWLPLALAMPFVLLAGLSLNRTLRRYDNPVARAHVVQVVAAG